jgi:Transcriptional Coactivator p15 (PC4)
MTDAFTGEVVYTFSKNTHEHVYVYIQEWHGQKLAHIRIFATGKDGIDHPTLRGVAISLDDLAHLEKAVVVLRAAAEGSEDA